MKNKFLFLTKMSLNRKIKTKWFLVANLILAIALTCIINIDSIIKTFGGDFDKVQKIHIVDKSNRSYELFETNLSATNEGLKAIKGDINYELVKSNKTVDEAKLEIEKNNKDLYIIFENDEVNSLKATLISEGYLDAIKYQVLNIAINNTKSVLAVTDLNIDYEEYAKISSPVAINRIYLEKDKKTTTENMESIMTTVFPVIILPFFMLTIFLVQMIGAEVNDEKSTRGMEIIISNVPPKIHFASKIVAGNLFVLIQGGLLFLFGFLGLFVKFIINGNDGVNSIKQTVGSALSGVLTTEFVNQLSYIIPLTLILMIITFIAYSLLAGILASMTTNIEDFQQLQTPIMLILLAGYYLSMMAGMFKGAVIIKIISYVPLISAILSPSLLVLGQIGIIDVLISLIILIGFNYLLIKYGMRIYKVGILNYSTKNLWKKMFKSLKN